MACGATIGLHICPSYITFLHLPVCYEPEQDVPEIVTQNRVGWP